MMRKYESKSFHIYFYGRCKTCHAEDIMKDFREAQLCRQACRAAPFVCIYANTEEIYNWFGTLYFLCCRFRLILYRKEKSFFIKLQGGPCIFLPNAACRFIVEFRRPGRSFKAFVV